MANPSNTSRGRNPIFPAAVTQWFGKFSLRLFGLLALLVSACYAVILFGYHTTDPSWNVTSAVPVANLLGVPGAVIADIMFQGLGLACVFPGVIVAGWGCQMIMLRKPPLIAWRLLVLLLASVILSFGFAGASSGSNFGIDAGLGGIIGLVIRQSLMLIPGMEALIDYPRIAINILAIPATLYLWALRLSEVIHIVATIGIWMIKGLKLGYDGIKFATLSCIRLLARSGKLVPPIANFLQANGNELVVKSKLISAKYAPQPQPKDETQPSIGIDNRCVDLLAPRSRSIFRLRHRNKLGISFDNAEFGNYAAGNNADSDKIVDDLEDSNTAQTFASDNPEPTTQPAPQRQSVVERACSRVQERLHTKTRESKRARESQQMHLKIEQDGFELPNINFLSIPKQARGINMLSPQDLEQNARMLEGVLEDFGIRGEIINIRPGPVVTLYELEPAPGTKTSRVIGLSDDIARSMSAISVRIATIPGRSVIGIELPNQNREGVFLRELLASESYEKSTHKLPIILGKDIGGEPIIADMASAPHMLIAGTTGSGKSVGLNAMILSLLYRMTPAECRFIMVDPKMLELSVYDNIPHLLAPVVTDPKKAVVALKWVVREMEQRYRAMAKLSVRNVSSYNAKVKQAIKDGSDLTRKVQTGFDDETGQPVHESEVLDNKPLPYIVVVVDEMADLMLVAGKEIEQSIQRLAQMARAAGIHIIMATQRPSVDVITGTIKANFPTRISFMVSSKIDSRTILGEQGGEQLLGRGDMLYMAGGGRITRVHGPFVDDDEVEKVCSHLRTQGVPDYIESVIMEEDQDDALGESRPSASGDDLYDQAVALVAREGKASTSFIQRHLQIGYNRAARIIETMEKQGVVSAANHVGKREILIGNHD